MAWRNNASPYPLEWLDCLPAMYLSLLHTRDGPQKSALFVLLSTDRHTLGMSSFGETGALGTRDLERQRLHPSGMDKEIKIDVFSQAKHTGQKYHLLHISDSSNWPMNIKYFWRSWLFLSTLLQNFSLLNFTGLACAYLLI